MNDLPGEIYDILTLAAYAVALYFYAGLSLRLFRWALAGSEKKYAPGRSHTNPLLFAFDMLFLRRLLAINAILWVGEWVFHVSLVLVLLSHLRYFFDPAPEILAVTAHLGKLAAYTMPASLAYILIFRLLALVFVRGYFTSMYNMFLSTVILLASVTGFFLRHAYRADIAGIKEYMVGFLAFKPAGFPDSAMFAAHFALFLVVMVAVPTHIFAAPLTLMDAASRQGSIERFMREDED